VSGADLTSTQINHLLTDAPFAPSTSNATEIAANQAYGSALLNYLRGDRSNEDASPYFFRERNSKLGDIVDSDPKFVGPPRFRYSDATSFAPKPYSAYVTANASRIPMVYVGANDGMLHGFREDTGEEVLAYIPNKVFQNLSVLSDPLYQHRHYVNEAPTIVDAFLPTKTDPITGTAGAWRTVLVGSLGGGGQSIYALDVSNPAGFSEASASNIVLWEFDDTDDQDLGFTYGEVQVAKMQNDVWAAVFSNGYNNTTADGNASTTGKAYLYIVNLETGALIKKIDTGAGSTGTPNGLSTPSLIDTDGDGEVDTIYAGDMQGKVWKFDVSSSNPSSWDVAYKTGTTPTPLFTTVDSQPITTPIQVAYHPEGRFGFMLYFGTGKYIEPNDNAISAQPTQAFYGIWDKDQAPLTAFTSSKLMLQESSDQVSLNFDNDEDGDTDVTKSVRKSTNHAINYDSHMGWYIKLLPVKVNGVANSSNFGEKQVSRAVVRDGRVIFTTLVPSQDSCDFGGSSFIMSLNYTNGGQLLFPAFDLNGDGTFDGGDPLVAGVQSDVGIVPTVSILTDNDRDIGFASGSSGDVETVELNVGDAALGRQSWREIE
jgi:type IV pilus assembly protein PilY1